MSTELNTEQLLAENVELQTKVEALELQLAAQLNSNTYGKALSDSINYAVRIQSAIMQPEHIIKSFLPKNFIMYRPKDIVSGDFYFVGGNEEKVVFASVDCTGHGVPGAFMSIIGNNQLNAAVKEDDLTTPSLILDRLSQGVSDTLRQTSEEEAGIKDGMDIALLSIDFENMVLEYAGAYNPLYIFRDGKLLETKGDKFPIGISIDGTLRLFANHEFKLQKGDCIYIFSDGFADQFGGSKGKKYKSANMKKLLLSISQKPMEEQKQLLEEAFKNWKGSNDQIDDVCIIGVRV